MVFRSAVEAVVMHQAFPVKIPIAFELGYLGVYRGQREIRLLFRWLATWKTSEKELQWIAHGRHRFSCMYRQSYFRVPYSLPEVDRLLLIFGDYPQASPCQSAVDGFSAMHQMRVLGLHNGFNNTYSFVRSFLLFS